MASRMHFPRLFYILPAVGMAALYYAIVYQDRTAILLTAVLLTDIFLPAGNVRHPSPQPQISVGVCHRLWFYCFLLKLDTLLLEGLEIVLPGPSPYTNVLRWQGWQSWHTSGRAGANHKYQNASVPSLITLRVQEWKAFHESRIFDTWRRYFNLRVVLPHPPFLDQTKHHLLVQFPHACFPFGGLLTQTLAGDASLGMPSGPVYGVIASVLLQIPIFKHFFAWVGCEPASKFCQYAQLSPMNCRMSAHAYLASSLRQLQAPRTPWLLNTVPLWEKRWWRFGWQLGLQDNLSSCW